MNAPKPVSTNNINTGKNKDKVIVAQPKFPILDLLFSFLSLFSASDHIIPDGDRNECKNDRNIEPEEVLLMKRLKTERAVRQHEREIDELKRTVSEL